MDQPDLELAARICDFFNELLEQDRPAIASLLANRVPCNKTLAEHPTVQVTTQNGGFHVGLLGLLNGLCGVHDDQTGPVWMVFDDSNVENFPSLKCLELTPKAEAATLNDSE